MPDIDLICDADCPNARQARINLRRALEMAGFPGGWREWVRTDVATPHDLRRFGSPTILVDGRDVAGASPSTAPAPVASIRTRTSSAGGFRVCR